jgi:hypothetical protein
VQYRPTAAELLGTMADLLGDEVLAAVPEHLKHRVRVAENLARILERESRLAPGADADEQRRLAGLLGHDGALEAQRAELNERLRHSDDPGFDQAAWEALVAITRADLAIAKPGHDAWEGG